jgi:hypothetical protein
MGTNPATLNMLTDVVTEYKKLYRGSGVLPTATLATSNAVKEATDQFINGKAIFAGIILGEMESPTMREVKFTRGVLPFPKYNASQEEFLTIVHDQAEVGAILVTAKSPTMASAYMQALNEKSRKVLTEYYENSLKVKYNTAGDSEGGVRLMIDLIYDTIDSPFESLITNYICNQASTDTSNISLYSYMTQDAQTGGTQFSTKYKAAVNALQTALNDLYSLYTDRLK